MAKPPIDESALLKAITDALSASGMSVGQKQIRAAMGSVTKSVGRKAPKITAKTAAGGAGRKPPKPPKSGVAAPKGPKKRDPLGSPAQVNRYLNRQGKIASEFRKKGGEVDLVEGAMADGYEKGIYLSTRKPKPPASGSPARKPSPKPKKPSGAASKLTRVQKREANVAAHWAGREKYLADSSAASKARKAETRSQNQAAWAKRQDEMEARRMAGREKYNKKKGAK